MSISIPEYYNNTFEANEPKADELLAQAKVNPSAYCFEAFFVNANIGLRDALARPSASTYNYFHALFIVLLKKGYTYESIKSASTFIRQESVKPAEFHISFTNEQQSEWIAAEYAQAIALLKKADAPAPIVADAPAKTKSTTPFLGSFVALAFAFSLSIVGCYIQPSGLSVRAYESKLNTMPTSTADAKCDKHQQHFELLQSRLKHGHSEALYFIKNYSKTAEQLGRAYDISPEIILAVGILESSSGTSNISVCSRNFHGIKAYSDWHGLTFTCLKGTTWRAWNSAADGFEGFCQYICERMPHFVGKNITPAEFAAAYGSSDPKRYAEQLHLIITRYGLKTLFS